MSNTARHRTRYLNSCAVPSTSRHSRTTTSTRSPPVPTPAFSSAARAGRTESSKSGRRFLGRHRISIAWTSLAELALANKLWPSPFGVVAVLVPFGKKKKTPFHIVHTWNFLSSVSCLDFHLYPRYSCSTCGTPHNCCSRHTPPQSGSCVLHLSLSFLDMEGVGRG